MNVACVVLLPSCKLMRAGTVTYISAEPAKSNCKKYEIANFSLRLRTLATLSRP